MEAEVPAGQGRAATLEAAQHLVSGTRCHGDVEAGRTVGLVDSAGPTERAGQWGAEGSCEAASYGRGRQRVGPPYEELHGASRDGADTGDRGNRDVGDNGDIGDNGDNGDNRDNRDNGDNGDIRDSRDSNNSTRSRGTG
jgi:hypothetical protein